MATPAVTPQPQDGNLGLAASQTDSVTVIVGDCTLGSVNTLQDFDQASPTQVKAAAGYGRAAQLAASLCSTPGHGPVVLIRATSAAGIVGAVSSTGTAPPILTITGTPYDDGTVKAEILQAGARGTATFRYSRDNGTTWSPEIVTAATYLIADLGVTLNFPVGAYSVNNRYEFSCTAPTLSNTNVTDALEALRTSGREFGQCIILTSPTGAADADRATAMASLFAAVSTKAGLFEAAYKYAVFVIEAGKPVAGDVAGMTAWRAALVAAAPALTDKRLLIAAGQCLKASDLDGLAYARNAIFPVAERLSSVPISEDLGRVRSGALRGVTAIDHDEESIGGLGNSRYTTLRRIAGRTGFYITEGLTFAAPGSDYGLVQMVRVINNASKTARNGALDWLNDSVIANAANGRIREVDAINIESDIRDQLEQQLLGAPPHVSAIDVRVNRSLNIVSGRTLSLEVLCVPLGYLKQINIPLGFTKSLAQAA